MLEQRPLEPSLRTSDELSSRHRDFAGGRLIETRPRIRTSGWPLACGHLGRMTKEELPDALGEALFAIDAGEIVGPVQLGELWAVCTAHPPAEAPSEEEDSSLREEIVETLLDEAAAYAVVQRGYLTGD